MHFIYIIKSKKDASLYVGSTDDLRRRFAEHNRGNVRFTHNKTPYELAWYAGFRNKKLAIKFEKYLKSSSGFAFRNKHLI